jgi:hypothetical protein
MNMNMMKRIRATVGGRPPAVSRRARSAGLLVAALAVAGSGLAGCGGSGGSSSASSSAPARSGGGGTDSAQAVKYSQCMRKNGLPSFPDPVNGQLQLMVTKGGALDPDSPQFQAAQKACKSFEPPGLGSGAGQNPQQQSQMLKYVSCMRKNGVPDFPDPQGGTIKFTGGKVDPNSAQFKSAMQTCRKLLSGGAPGSTP